MTFVLFAAEKGFLDAVPVDRIGDYEEQMLAYVKGQHAGLLEEIGSAGKFTDDIAANIKSALSDFASTFA